jgi:YaiO family outer membrane protein
MKERRGCGQPAPSIVRFTVGTIVCLLVCLAAVRPAVAQNGFYVEAAGDYSPVEIGTSHQIWKNARLSTGFFEDGRSGWNLTLERQQRDRLVDWGGLARGFRRNGNWTVSGGIGLGADASFSYRRSFEGEVARTVVGSLVAHGGYRYLEFTTATVHLIQPAVTLYLPRGDIGARYFIVRNGTRATTTGTLLVQGTVTAHRRLKLGGGGAFGERIFDIASLSTPDAAAWVGFAFAHFNASPHWSIDAGVGRAHEDPLFSQGTFTLGVRRTFGGPP